MPLSNLLPDLKVKRIHRLPLRNEREQKKGSAVTGAYVIGDMRTLCCDPLMSHTIRRIFFPHLAKFAALCGK